MKYRNLVVVLTNTKKGIPEEIKKEVGTYANIYETASAIKKFSTQYEKYTFNRTTVNSWKAKSKNKSVFNKAGRPNILGKNLIKKVKDIAISTRAAGGVINRKQILHIAKGVIIIIILLFIYLRLTKNRKNCIKIFT